MRVTRVLNFIFQFATIGLAAAFLVLYFKPSLDNGLLSSHPTVEIEQSTRTVNNANTDKLVSYADAVELAAPAVVNIQTKKLIQERRTHPLMDDPLFKHFFGEGQQAPQQRQETSLGSGVIVSKQGYILTNNHVIEAADEIEIALRDGRMAAAKIVATDPESDLAVLKIQLDKLPVITLARQENLRVGDVVLAIGNPFGVGQTVTSGIVSATGRDS